MEKEVIKTVREKKCKRERLRLRHLAAVELKTAHGKVIRGNLRDIGIESMFVRVEKKLVGLLQLGENVDIALSVTQGESRLTISFPGKVIRSDDDGFALIFTEKLKWWPIFSLFPVNEQFLFDVVTKA
jgi:hypothetical protein